MSPRIFLEATGLALNQPKIFRSYLALRVHYALADVRYY